MSVKVNSDKVRYEADRIVSQYEYNSTSVTKGKTRIHGLASACGVIKKSLDSIRFAFSHLMVLEGADGSVTVVPTKTEYQFTTETKLPKLGMMLVGWGGNNGSTVTASIVANRKKMSWVTRTGTQKANYLGSVTQSSTINMGPDAATGHDVFVPLSSMVPLVHPNDLVIGGWDISKKNLYQSLQRAQVLEPDLIRQVEDDLKGFVPLPSIYYPDFIAANQGGRADNVLPGTDKNEHLERIRQDMRDFKKENSLDKLIVCWTANTERFAEIVEGVNDTADNLLAAIKSSHAEVSPSTVFAVACILENVPFINGSPQNTFVPGCVELAERHKAFIGGDDFKSGQTKMKSVLVDFLVNAGIKPISIASYNHLGNNDGFNLSAPAQFRSKEITKTNVVDDMVEANHLLYEKGERPDHLVVIKYMPNVGDSKRALDEYFCEIFMGGRQNISMHNTCEDSLLASPLIIDLVVLAELMTRISYQCPGQERQGFHSVLSLLSYLLKAPMVKSGAPVVNALGRQRSALENVLRALVALPPNNDMQLEHRLWTGNTKTSDQEP